MKNKVKLQKYFYTETKHLLSQYGEISESTIYSVRTLATIITHYGTLEVTVNEDNDFAFSVFCRFLGDFDLSSFRRIIGEDAGLNKFSLKWNIHEEKAEDALSILGKRLEILTKTE